MNLYEILLNKALEQPDCEVESLVLGWHASGIVLRDGRWGLGAVPNPLKEAHVVREQHTQKILTSSAHDLVRLIVSPFPQEFAAATAAISALLPPPAGGMSLDLIRLMPRDEKVAVLGYHRAIVPFLRDWQWQLVIFDDYRKAPDIHLEEAIEEKIGEAQWVWMTAEALRDRALPVLNEKLKRMNGVFLQAPGVPWLELGYRDIGVNYLVLPHLAENARSRDVIAKIAVGGDPWNDEGLVWKVHLV